MESKECIKCKTVKTLDNFYTTKCGACINECNDCKSTYFKNYRANNRKRMNEYNKKARDARRVLNPPKYPRKPVTGLCEKKQCGYPSVTYEGITRFCKSHAIDYIFNIDDV